MTTIPLGPASLTGSSDLPGDFGRAVLFSSAASGALIASLFGLAPCGVLPATHLAMRAVRSYRTFSPLLARVAADVSCVFSVPLSFELPRPGVTRRTALRSSDFPPAFALRATRLRAAARQALCQACRAEARVAQRRERRPAVIWSAATNHDPSISRLIPA